MTRTDQTSTQEEPKLSVPKIGKDALPVKIGLEAGKPLFILGANGTGKSSLFFHWIREDRERRTLIAGNRDIIAPEHDNVMSEFDKHTSNALRHPAARTTTGLHNDQRAFTHLVRKLVSADHKWLENERAGILQKPRPLDILNKALSYSDSRLQIRFDEIHNLAAATENGDIFNYAELSDGQRSVLLLVAAIITAG